MKPAIILDEHHFVDDASSETVVRYIPRLAPGPTHSGTITFAVFDTLLSDPPEKRRLVQAQAIESASDTLFALADRCMEQAADLTYERLTP